MCSSRFHPSCVCGASLLEPPMQSRPCTFPRRLRKAGRLAEKHAVTLGRLLAEEATPFALLTGATPAPRRREALERLASGELSLIVGTHALIEPTVQFARLGLCVVDEQHRFVVEQRKALDSKGVEGLAPHILHMTATPIPRTLSLTTYGDLDTTALHELPSGRKPVQTRV